MVGVRRLGWWQGGTSVAVSEPVIAAAVREITFGQAVREALAEEMRRDPAVFIIGEDVAEAGGAVKRVFGALGKIVGGRGNDSPSSPTGPSGRALRAAEG